MAIIAAFTALILIGVCAFAVDLGNAFSRKRDVQSQADFAALAGANELGEGHDNLAVAAVADYLNRNKPQDDNAGPTPDVTPAQLTDHDDKNGEVYISGDSMRVVTPKALVDYGLAGVVGPGFDSVEVDAEATVKILSGGGVMPFFAVDGCDFGPQTITAPPPGPAVSLTLAFGSDNGGAALTDATPDQVDLNASPSPALTITGSGFTSSPAPAASKVGFFLNDGATFREVAITPTSDTTITVPTGLIPPDVLSTEDVWYVRVFKGTKWSKIDNAQPLRIGNAVLECIAAPTNGNFGSLLLPRLDANSSDWLPVNIAQGLQDPLTLAVHEEQKTGPVYTCSGGTNGAVTTPTSPANLIAGTNCVDTDTGLTDSFATTGFVAGGTKSGGVKFKGRLNADTTPGCGSNTSNRNARATVDIPNMDLPGHPDFQINDDILTCFLDTGVTINSIIQKLYPGPAVLSEDIFRSPRFFLQPVLGIPPTCGTCSKYSIIDFRPGFITDQPNSALGGSMTMGSSTDHNGLSVSGGKISKVKVVFFNIKALPPPPDDAPLSDYIGAGPKIIRLIN